MTKPKCDVCGTSEYMELTSYGETTGAIAGGVIGSGILRSKSILAKSECCKYIS
jgi:hypothetical protein